MCRRTLRRGMNRAHAGVEEASLTCLWCRLCVHIHAARRHNESNCGRAEMGCKFHDSNVKFVVLCAEPGRGKNRSGIEAFYWTCNNPHSHSEDYMQ